MQEKFAIPTVGAIVVKRTENEELILVQNRKKNNGDGWFVINTCWKNQRI